MIRMKIQMIRMKIQDTHFIITYKERFWTDESIIWCVIILHMAEAAYALLFVST